MADAVTRGALLSVHGTFAELRDLIRTDQPSITDADVKNPCTAAACSTWGEYHAPEANWYYTQIADRVVAGRMSKVGDGVDWDLVTTTRGHFALAVLRKPDFLCPGRPDERCYPNEADEPLFCESDFSVACDPDGVEASIEVFDFSQLVVHRTENVRHLGTWEAMVLASGGLRLELETCGFDF